MRSLVRALSGIVAAMALTLAFHPGPVQAQEQEGGAQQECTAELSPKQIAPGQAAVPVEARLSEDVGVVSSFRAAEESGLALASPEDFAKEKMTREEGEQPEPIQMADQGNRAQIWLNTAEAETGQHAVVLEGASGRCTAQLTVKEEPGS